MGKSMKKFDFPYWPGNLSKNLKTQLEQNASWEYLYHEAYQSLFFMENKSVFCIACLRCLEMRFAGVFGNFFGNHYIKQI